MIVTVSTLVFGYNNHKLFHATKKSQTIQFDFEPYVFGLKLKFNWRVL